MAQENVQNNSRASDVVGSVTVASWGRRLMALLVRPLPGRSEFALAMILGVSTLASGVATFLAMLDVGGFTASDDGILLLLFSDLILLFGMVFLVVRRLLHIFLSRPSGQHLGASFRVRMVLVFALFSTVPAVFLLSFSLLFLDFGMANWFSQRVKTTVEESKAVARAYLDEHLNSITVDALFLARSVSSQLSVSDNLRDIDVILDFNARFRDISEAVIFRRNGPVVGRYGLTFDLEFEVIPEWAFASARRGEVALLRNVLDRERRIRALVELDGLENYYLVVGRAIDPQVLAHVRKTEATVSQYSDLEVNRLNFQISSTLVFILVSFLVLLAAVLGGIQFASSLWSPIESLIRATARVAKGDFVPLDLPRRRSSDEIGVLSASFNEMTHKLGLQRDELLDTARQLDRRRRFSEAVLSGVRAGVIGLDRDGRIDLPNRRAEELLEIPLSDYRGEFLGDIVSDFGDLLALALGESGSGGGVVEDRVNVVIGEALDASGGVREKEFFVWIGTQVDPDGVIVGYVVTFDDLTDLLAAQRQAAWADIARRIAHEVKNPLTPIQLSAERLRRRYSDKIGASEGGESKKIFDDCTSTIIRQVHDIGALIEEFSSFARMPKAVMERHDVAEICRHAVLLEQNRFSGVIKSEGLDVPLLVDCDRHQVSQMLINLIKNSIEAFDNKGKFGSEICVSLSSDEAFIFITVSDNGCGFASLRGRDWTRPYVTSKEGGSGLGLAVVKKIVDDHGGRLDLRNRAEGGAEVVVSLPRDGGADGGESGDGDERGESGDGDEIADGQRIG